MLGPSVAGYPLPVWCRAVPTLCIRAPHKDEKMAATRKILASTAQNTWFFMRMKWISISTSKIGAGWQPCGQQMRIVIPIYNDNTILLEPYTTAQERSVALVGQQKFGAVHHHAEAPLSPLPTGINHHAHRR